MSCTHNLYSALISRGPKGKHGAHSNQDGRGGFVHEGSGCDGMDGAPGLEGRRDRAQPVLFAALSCSGTGLLLEPDGEGGAVGRSVPGQEQ